MKDTAILWDLDGTLLDTLEDLCDGVNYALDRFGCPQRSLEEVRSFVGNGAGLLIHRALNGSGREGQEAEVLACFRAYYDAYCRVKTGPYPGILDVLQQLKAEGYPMAVVSNKPDSAVQILCRDHFGDLITCTAGEIRGCPRKPEPDMVFRAAEELGVAPEHCIYVGDSEVDIQTAANAGMRCISVLWGFRDEQLLRKQGGTHFCPEPELLREFVKELENLIHGK